jgi:hypothetical protein
MKAIYQTECLRSALRTLENAVLRAYLSTGGAAYHDLQEGISAHLSTVRAYINRADRCPDGSQPIDGMCEFPSGSGNYVPIPDAWDEAYCD